MLYQNATKLPSLIAGPWVPDKNWLCRHHDIITVFFYATIYIARYFWYNTRTSFLEVVFMARKQRWQPLEHGKEHSAAGAENFSVQFCLQFGKIYSFSGSRDRESWDARTSNSSINGTEISCNMSFPFMLSFGRGVQSEFSLACTVLGGVDCSWSLCANGHTLDLSCIWIKYATAPHA